MAPLPEPFSTLVATAAVQLPMEEPDPVAFYLEGLLSLAVQIVALWLLWRIARYCWRPIAERVRHDRREDEPETQSEDRTEGTA